MKRMLILVAVVALVVVVLAGQRVLASWLKQPPWTTHLAVLALPALPWVKMETPSSFALTLPFGFHARGPDAKKSGVVHAPFGFGDYRTEHPLGGGTTHQPIQVDVVAADAADALAGRFFNSAAFVAIGAADPDRTEPLPGSRGTIAHYDRTTRSEPLRAVVIVDDVRRLRVEVVDQLHHFDEAGLRAFALQVHGALGPL